MPTLPSKRKMDRALVEAVRAAKALVKEANRAAGRYVAKGDYTRSERLIDTAKSAAGLGAEIAQLRKRAKEALAASTAIGSSKDRTPLWQYYRLTLSALSALGGSASRNEIEAQMEKSSLGELKPADLETNARGVPWWRIMVRRSRKHMLKEKFIERGAGMSWVLTPGGKKALEAQRFKDE